MLKEIITTNNSLLDIINWLKNNHIVCLYTQYYKIYYFNKETLNEINNENIIYVNMSICPLLLCETEWPCYIENAGFVKYKSCNILPIIKENIHKFEI
jgi:hypothetical protein